MSPNRVLLHAAALLTSGITVPASAAAVPPAPQVDYHQHLVSPAFARIVNLPAFDADALLKRLDAAGVRRAVVLSTGYSMADERKGLAEPDRLTREENDWTSAQMIRGRGRLIGFCGVNPLRQAALDELDRCLSLPGMRGIKLHFGNSGVSLRDPAQLTRMQQVFALADRRKAPVLVHMRARGGENFGAPDAQLFIDHLLPLVPHSDVIVAHLGGAGPGYPAQADAVMGVFAAAAERGDKRVRRTYFDLATVVTADISAADAKLIAKRIRQISPAHVLYGSDLLVAPSAPSIAEAWGHITSKLGLTIPELRTIASNQLPFVS